MNRMSRNDLFPGASILDILCILFVSRFEIVVKNQEGEPEILSGKGRGLLVKEPMVAYPNIILIIFKGCE